MTAPYGTGYAELYDLFYRDKPYGSEAEFLRRELREHGVARGGRVLELACGTGEHAIRLAKRGYAVTATDGSQAMIELARKKAERQRASVAFSRHDMRKVPVPAQPFDAVLCLFDSIGYVKTDGAIATVLDRVHGSLRSGGLFIVEFWHAPAMLNGFDRVRVRRFRRGKTTFLRVSETELEPRRSLAHVNYNVYELRGDLTYRHIRESHTNRYFTVAEMEKLARGHGFVPLAAYDGFRNTPVSDQSWHVLSIWRKSRLGSRRRARSKTLVRTHSIQ
jgi:SAM-dependent methyltransferase